MSGQSTWRPARAPAVVLVCCFLAGACGSSAVTGTPSAGATASASPGPTVPPGTVVVRWFVGLGSGTSPGYMTVPEKSFVKAFNASQDRIYINLEIVPNANAYDILKMQIAAGSPPDIVGPVGVRGRNGMTGAFLDIAPLMASHNVDSSVWTPAMLDLLKEPDGAQIGLPYLMYPAYMFYNKDLFKTAGLPDLPKRAGELYIGNDWDWNTVAEIGRQLTLDANGKHPGEKGFDSNNIVQWGFDAQWWDGRRLASAFGGGSFVSADGRTAQIPPQWADAWNWYYDAMWKWHIAPTGKYRSSALLNQGTTVSSGRIAMDAANGWSINSYSYGARDNHAIDAWDMAVMPSWNGQTSGPMDMDTFAIPKGCAHPDEAFEAMLAIMADEQLRIVYGGTPAAFPDHQAWFDAFDKYLAYSYPDNQVSWSVLQEMAQYPALPSHESDMPGALDAIDLYNDFFTRLQSQPGLNVNAELARLRTDLQAAFDEALASPSP